MPIKGCTKEGPLGLDTLKIADRPPSEPVVGFQYAEYWFDDAPSFGKSRLVSVNGAVK